MTDPIIRAVVTGAARRIGSATAVRLEADGYEVVRLGEDLAAGTPSHGAGEQAQLFGLCRSR